MKKLLVALSFVIVTMVVIFFFFPYLFFVTAWGQKFYLEMEGEEVATFYFKENQSSGDTLYMQGVIYSNTLEDMIEVFDNNPEITTLTMVEVPGSMDDDINLLASREIRKRNINTYLPRDGMVASGGTDMFLAGKERGMHETAQLGVHSWGGGDQEALEYPRDHEEHKKYLEYYTEMEIPTEFYWYTLEAAPAESIHWMSFDEIGKYQVLTNTLDVSQMLRIQQKLASDGFAGRAAGSNERAQGLLSEYFTNLGLKAFKDGYAMPFDFLAETSGAEMSGANIVGYIAGTVYPDQYFVVGAHYDHLGVVDGVIYNGADDNASGTAALLILAKYFSLYPPQHSIIFAAFDAEEMGLHGSQYFVENPPVDLTKVLLNFNFDMISRNPGNEIYVVGTHEYPQFKSLITQHIEESGLTVSFGHDDPKDKTKEYWMYSSDNGPFFEKGIPNITFSEEDHPGYHQPEDDFEHIHPEFYKNVVRLIKNSITSIDQEFPLEKSN